MDLTDVLQNFAEISNEDDRFRYLYELGLMLGPMPQELYCDQNRVRGCSSQVWLETLISHDPEGSPVLSFRGDSDSHIIRGLLTIVLGVYSRRRPWEIIEVDPTPIFHSVGLGDHITSQRANGIRALISRIQKDARDHMPDRDKPL